jgi:hypothetical protein
MMERIINAFEKLNRLNLAITSCIVVRFLQGYIGAVKLSHCVKVDLSTIGNIIDNLFENFLRMFTEIARRKIVEFGLDSVSTCSLGMGCLTSGLVCD